VAVYQPYTNNTEVTLVNVAWGFVVKFKPSDPKSTFIVAVAEAGVAIVANVDPLLESLRTIEPAVPAHTAYIVNILAGTVATSPVEVTVEVVVPAVVKINAIFFFLLRDGVITPRPGYII
jgi:hypothetical protein